MIAGMPDPAGPAPDQDLPTRQFGWWDMFVSPDEDPRTDGGFRGRAGHAGRVPALTSALTLELKCSGLDAERWPAARWSPPRCRCWGWCGTWPTSSAAGSGGVMAGQDAPPHFCSDGDPDGDFDGAVRRPRGGRRGVGAWRAEVAFAERFVADAPDLDVTGTTGTGRVSLREVLVHMIEEYARHNGHADLLRERIDGRVGQ